MNVVSAAAPVGSLALHSGERGGGGATRECWKCTRQERQWTRKGSTE